MTTPPRYQQATYLPPVDGAVKLISLASWSYVFEHREVRREYFDKFFMAQALGSSIRSEDVLEKDTVLFGAKHPMSVSEAMHKNWLRKLTR
eukprot:gene11790-biopygen263